MSADMQAHAGASATLFRASEQLRQTVAMVEDLENVLGLSLIHI